MINVLIYNGSDMCREYEFFCTNANKKEVVNLFIDIERYNTNNAAGKNPLEIFESKYIYHVIASTDSCCLSLQDVKLLKVDIEIDIDDISEFVEKENELFDKLTN